jgi:hypothetical protein
MTILSHEPSFAATDLILDSRDVSFGFATTAARVIQRVGVMCDDDDDACSCKVIGGGIVTLIGIILICVLVPMHFSYIDVNHIGFQKSKSGTVNTDVTFGRGRYGWGVTKKAVQFDSTWQRVAYLESKRPAVFTDAGEILIGIVFYYHVTKEGMSTTYKKFGTNYPLTIEKQALDAIKNTATNFSITEYQTMREVIAQEFYVAVNRTLTTLADVSVPREGFFLDHIDLPERVLDKRLDLFATEQLQLTQQYELRNQQYRRETLENTTRIEQRQSIVRSQSHVDAQGLRQNAQGRATSLLQIEIGRQLQNMIASLGLGSNANATRRLVKFNQLLDTLRPFTVLDDVLPLETGL